MSKLPHQQQLSLWDSVQALEKEPFEKGFAMVISGKMNKECFLVTSLLLLYIAPGHQTGQF